MKLRELLSELTFYGRPCTKDCSGHKAGWEWERKHNTNSRANTPSNSFNNGTEIAASQAKQGRQPIGPSVRGAKGRFQKVQKGPQQPLQELFDKPVKYNWAEDYSGYKSAVFTINDRTYKVGLTNELVNGEDMNLWDVEFQDLHAQDHFGITGKLGAQANILFSTVIAIVMDFKNTNPEATMKFTAKEPSRQKLYTRILGMLQQKGFKVKQAQSPSGKMGYLVR